MREPQRTEGRAGRPSPQASRPAVGGAPPRRSLRARRDATSRFECLRLYCFINFFAFVGMACLLLLIMSYQPGPVVTCFVDQLKRNWLLLLSYRNVLPPAAPLVGR